MFLFSLLFLVFHFWLFMAFISHICFLFFLFVFRFLLLIFLLTLIVSSSYFRSWFYLGSGPNFGFNYNCLFHIPKQLSTIALASHFWLFLAFWHALDAFFCRLILPPCYFFCMFKQGQFGVEVKLPNFFGVNLEQTFTFSKKKIDQGENTLR